METRVVVVAVLTVLLLFCVQISNGRMGGNPMLILKLEIVWIYPDNVLDFCGQIVCGGVFPQCNQDACACTAQASEGFCRIAWPERLTLMWLVAGCLMGILLISLSSSSLKLHIITSINNRIKTPFLSQIHFSPFGSLVKPPREIFWIFKILSRFFSVLQDSIEIPFESAIFFPDSFPIFKNLPSFLLNLQDSSVIPFESLRIF